MDSVLKKTAGAYMRASWEYQIKKGLTAIKAALINATRRLNSSAARPATTGTSRTPYNTDSARTPASLKPIWLLQPFKDR